MGKDGTYRWERRRKRREGQKARRAFQAFWGFELLLLFLVFFIGTAGIRMFLLQALNNSYCIEAVASYGGSQMFQSVFQAFFWLTIVGIFFWFAMSIAFHKIIWKSKSRIFHTAQLICLILLVGCFNALHIDNLDGPDGELPLKPLIVDLSNDEQKFFYRPDTFIRGEALDKYVYWSLGEPKNGDFEHINPSCVWADKGMITVQKFWHIDGYGDLEESKHLNAWYENNRLDMDWPVSLGLTDWQYFISAFYGPHTAAERFRDDQIYRSMTPDEVKQFKAKQACIDEVVLAKDMDGCEFYWVFRTEQFNWDHYDSPDPKPLEWH